MAAKAAPNVLESYVGCDVLIIIVKPETLLQAVNRYD